MSPQKDTVSGGAAAARLVSGDDAYEVQSRSRAITTDWAQEGDDTELEIIDASASNVREVGASVRRLVEALNTQSLFSSSKRVWFRNCNFLGEGRVAQSKETAERTEDLLD